MNVPLPLWIALILLSGYGNVRSYGDEEEESTTTYNETNVTPTPDYDYNATFDYYYVNATQRPDDQSATDGNVRSYGDEEEESTTTYNETSVTPTPDYDYDYNATFDYYYVNATQSVINSTEKEQIQGRDFRPDTRSLDSDKGSSEGNRVRQVGPVDQSLIISTLLASLAALLH